MQSYKKLKTAALAVLAAAVSAASCLSACSVKAENEEEHIHSYGEWVTVTQPGCTKEGLRERDCGCGDKQSERLPALGHGEAAWQYDEERHFKICPRCEEEYGSSSHMPDDGQCNVCGYEEKAEEALTYEYSEELGGYVVTSGDGENIEIPAEYEGRPVVAVGDYAFLEKGVKTVSLPPTVKTIGVQAFAKCASLTSVSPLTGVAEICNYAFWLSGIESAEINCDVGKQAFYQCAALKTLSLGAGVQTVGDYCFYDTGLTAVTVSCAPTYGKTPFKSDALKEVVIASSAPQGAYSAFRQLATLERFTVESGNGYYATKDGLLYSADYSSLLAVPKAVSGEIALADGLLKIGDQKFMNCTAVTKVVLPSSLLEIGASCFLGSGITEISLPDNVEKLGNYAFADCTSLRSVHIGAKIMYTNAAFKGCNSVTSFSVSPSNTKYRTLSGCLVSNTSTGGVELIAVLSDGVIPQGVTEIGSYLLSGRDMSSVTVPEGVKSIYRGAFSGCGNLSSVKLPSTLTYLDAYAFADCTSLTSVKIPSSVYHLSCWVFEGCTSLTSVTFENAAGWKMRKNGTMSSTAVSVDLSDAAANAAYFTDTHTGYIFERDR